MDMRVGAFDRSMSPTYGKNMELVSSIPKFFLASRKLRELKIFEAPESQRICLLAILFLKEKIDQLPHTTTHFGDKMRLESVKRC